MCREFFAEVDDIVLASVDVGTQAVMVSFAAKEHGQFSGACLNN